jgi:hypothetical protein
MITIHKYPLLMTDVQEVLSHDGAEPLAVQMQKGVPTLWARVDTGRPPTSMRVDIVGTGQDAEGVGDYVGTFHLEGGNLVFHVFTRLA